MSEDNVFKVAQYENVQCMVQSYQWGRGILIIRLKRRNSPDVQYLKFSGVEYFAGPMEWDGASFDRRSNEECLNMMRDAGRANEHVTEQHIEDMKFQLFTVTLPQTLVCIICKMVTRYSG